MTPSLLGTKSCTPESPVRSGVSNWNDAWWWDFLFFKSHGPKNRETYKREEFSPPHETHEAINEFYGTRMVKLKGGCGNPKRKKNQQEQEQVKFQRLNRFSKPVNWLYQLIGCLYILGESKLYMKEKEGKLQHCNRCNLRQAIELL